MYTKPSAYHKRITKEIEHLTAEAAEKSVKLTGDVTVEFIEGSLKFAWSLLLNFQAFLLLFIIGWAIIGIRWLVVEFADILYIFGKIISIAINFLIDGVNAVLSGVNAFTSLFGGGTHLHLKKLDPNGVWGTWISEARDIPRECAKFVSWQPVLGFFLGFLTKDNVCIFLRYIYPVAWLYDIFFPVLEWVSFDPTPFPEGENCDPEEIDFLCALLGLGYLILQFIIPLMILMLAVDSYSALIRTVLHLIEHILVFTLEALWRLVKLQYQGWLDIKLHWLELKLELMHMRHYHDKQHITPT